MSALFTDATRALARVVTPDTRIVVVLAAEPGADDDKPITLRMRVIDDCALEPQELAALLVKACDMSLDPAAKREDVVSAVQ
jgi:hypothetical protein